MSMKAQESSVSHNHLPYLCSEKETWLRPQKQTSYKVKTHEGHERQQRLQNLSVCLCGAAHREQYRARGVINKHIRENKQYHEGESQ